MSKPRARNLSVMVLSGDIVLSVASLVVFSMIIHALTTHKQTIPVKPAMMLSLVALACVLFLHGAVLYSRFRKAVAIYGTKKSCGFFVPNIVFVAGALGLFVSTVYCLANFNANVKDMVMPLSIANITFFSLILFFSLAFLCKRLLSKFKTHIILGDKENVIIRVSSPEEFVKAIFSENIGGVNSTIKDNYANSEGVLTSACYNLLNSLGKETDGIKRNEILKSALKNEGRLGESNNTQTFLALKGLLDMEEKDIDDMRALCKKYADFRGYTLEWREKVDSTSKTVEEPIITGIGGSIDRSVNA